MGEPRTAGRHGGLPGRSAPRPHRSSSVESVDYEGRTALIEIYSGRVALLNSTAETIWSMCNGECDENQILDGLEERFPQVGREILRRDLEVLLKELAAGEFITWEEPG